MNVVTTGPATIYLECKPENKRDASLRVLVDYHIGTDTHVVRLDTMRGGVQMAIGFHTGTPSAGSDLKMPSNLLGFSVRAHSEDLIAALRGMADRLEQQVKEDADPSHD